MDKFEKRYKQRRQKQRLNTAIYGIGIAVMFSILGFITAQNWIISTQKVIDISNNTAYIEIFGNVHKYEVK